MNDPASDVAAAINHARAVTADAATAGDPVSSTAEPITAAVPIGHDGEREPDTFEQFCAAGLWSGVGPALLGRMAEAGMSQASAVTEQALAALPSVTSKRAQRLFSAWVAAWPTYEVAQLLVPRGLPVRWAPRLAGALGIDPAAALVADPWHLLLVREAGVAQADGLARAVQPDVRPDDPRRGAAIVRWMLIRHARDGHTASPWAMIGPELRSFGFPDAQRAENAVQKAIAAGVVRPVPDPDGSGETWLAATPLADAEDAIARHVRRLRDTARPLATDVAARGAATDLDSKQREAVVAAAQHGVSLLTGGPGTGKSRTVTAIVALCRRAGREIALAAPTGRAAKRLSELLAIASDAGQPSTGTVSADGAVSADGIMDEAMTIHRLLGARPVALDGTSVFEHDADDPISADMVVIDETSMLDAELAAALLAAIPDGAHVLFVGDPAQLPSIGAGRVLGDLIASHTFPTMELTTVYRHAEGGAIARLATSVRGGELTTPDADDHEVAVVPADSSLVAAHRVQQLVTDSIPRVFGLAAEQIQVVTPIHRGPAGTEELNRMLKKQLNPGPHPGRTVRGFDVGDRVVATANYLAAEPTGYANGEVGTVIDTGSKSVTVAFPGGEAEVSGKALNDLVHGWALTVHRAQGSEWDAVIVVIPPEAGRMLSRPLVYTALTRARTHLSVVTAAGRSLAHAVRRVGARPRRTRLASLLHDAEAV